MALLSYALTECSLVSLSYLSQVRNTDIKEWDFTTALHTYIGVADAASPAVSVLGMQVRVCDNTELLASPSELSASPSELVASPSEP
jgi:D-hexose-6-phosphate mutarotase